MRQIKMSKPDTSVCDQAGYNKGPLTWQLMQRHIKENGTEKHNEIMTMLSKMRKAKELNSGMFFARVKNLYKQAGGV